MITKLPELQPCVERYAAMQFEPLAVTATLCQSIVQYDPIYIDNLLARCVLETALNPRPPYSLPRANYELPVPLRRLWTSPDGFPLWAASVFLPVGREVKGVVYLHKRLGCFEFSKKQPKSNVGRWMDRRIPKPIAQSETGRWQAFCIGNADEILSLLPLVRFLGKHRNVGFGEVAEWEVSQWDGDEIQTMVQGGKLVHAIPRGAETELAIQPESPPSLVGWTPPQWKPELFSPGWRLTSGCTLARKDTGRGRQEKRHE